ncbi:hypothetical protein Cfor_11277 [Coptotermes formosanus]|uniref:Major facilitator superfamily (MFS) profile domain-containing protein n=1 Tax=Coptotermes formosanus TaxID=36987 RepID=A0A6L2Q6T9_COPFO|nr:hypothetical protein Cfor_11277 [Coptotermes formosanus]
MGYRGSTSDALQEAVGDFGRWQAGISLLMALLKLPAAWFQLSIIILEARTDFWCARPHNLYGNLTIEEWKNFSHPRLENGGYDACRMYNLNYTSDGAGDAAGRGGTVACKNWEYSRAVFEENIVTEVSISLKICSDNRQWIGRKVPLVIAIGIQAGAGILAALSPWFIAFLVARFIMAVSTGGTMVISFVLVMEIVGNKWRSTIAILYQIPFSLGICVMVGVSYLQRDWRDFHFTLSAVSALFLVYWWLIPESPRWLMAVGREPEALRILENAARWNGRDVTAIKEVAQRLRPDREAPNSDKKATLADLMRTPNLRWNSLLLFVTWFLAGLCFYGFTQSLGKVGGNIFVTTVIAGEIETCCPERPFIRLKGPPFQTHRIICSRNCGSKEHASFPGIFPGDWPRVMLSAIALIGMCVAFPAVHVFSGEIFPTVVRNVGLGSACMFSRFGSVLAPFITSSEAFGAFWPPLIFGCCSLLGAATTAFLPETKNCRLPDTLQDGEQFGKYVPHVNGLTQQ